MKRIALVTIDKGVYQKDNILYNISLVFRNLVHMFIPNKIDINIIEDQITLYVIKIFTKENTIKIKLERLFKYIIEQQIDVVAFDKDIMDNYYENIQEFIKDSGIYLSNGDNVFFTLIIRTLKKVLKTKGWSLGNIDVAIVSETDSYYAQTFIKQLSPHVKYLTYVCKERSDFRVLIDDIFNNLGFSIRICSDIKQCINEVNLIINLTNKNIVTSSSNTNNIVICNIADIDNIKVIPANVSILKDISIALTKTIKLLLENKMRYKLCEMYILSKLDKLYLLKQEPDEYDFSQIYSSFRDNGFKILGLDGINL